MSTIDFGLGLDESRAVGSLAERLADVPGVAAVVLGGSRAVGTHREGSDVDLGVYYHDEASLDLIALRALAAEVDDGPSPLVTDPWEWGRWVNGGAWLTVGGRRVDWIYRRATHVDEVLRELGRGEIEVDWMQQPPFGFPSPLYGAETALCVPLCDDQGVVARLKELVRVYPEALRSSIVQSWTWAADFALRKGAGFAASGDVPNTVGCLSRACWFLAQVVHGLDRQWCFPDPKSVDHAAVLPSAPRNFATRVRSVLGNAGTEPASLGASIVSARALLDEITATAGDLYRAPPFPS